LEFYSISFSFFARGARVAESDASLAEAVEVGTGGGKPPTAPPTFKSNPASGGKPPIAVPLPNELRSGNAEPPTVATVGKAVNGADRSGNPAIAGKAEAEAADESVDGVRLVNGRVDEPESNVGIAESDDKSGIPLTDEVVVNDPKSGIPDNEEG